MITIELKQIRKGAGGWTLTKKLNGVAVLNEWYSSYANALNRAQWFERMDWRARIVKIR